MAVSYNTTDLVSRIRRMAQLATTNLKLTDAEILQIADECIQSSLWPQLRSCVEDYALAEYFLFVGPQTVPSGSVGDGSFVRLPQRASGSTVSVVSVVTTSSGDRPLTRIDPEETIKYGNPTTGNTITGSEPVGYTIIGDIIRVVPAPTALTTLRIQFERRPSRLVPVASCAAILSWTTSPSQTITATAALPSTFVANTLIDLIRRDPQQTTPIADDFFIVSTTTPTFTFSNGSSLLNVPNTMSHVTAGDFVCLAGETCIFPLPEVWWPVCIAESAADCLQQCGYMEEAATQRQAIADKTALAVRHSANRVRKQPKPVFDRNSPTRLSRRRYNAYWGQS